MDLRLEVEYGNSMHFKTGNSSYDGGDKAFEFNGTGQHRN